MSKVYKLSEYVKGLTGLDTRGITDEDLRVICNHISIGQIVGTLNEEDTKDFVDLWKWFVEAGE